MRKRSKLPILAASTVMILALIGCSDTVTSNIGRVETSLIGPESASGGKNIQERIFHADAFDRIDVRSEAMEVRVEPSPDDRITARLITDKAIDNPFVFDASIENGMLRLSVDEKTKINVLDRVQNGERKLILSLPDKPYKKVAIRNEFGSVDMADLAADRVVVKQSAGDIRLSGVSGELELETETGKIEAEGVTLDHDIFARTSVGDIEVRFGAPPEAGSIRAKTTLGYVRVDIDGVRYSENLGNYKAGRLASEGPSLEAVSEAGSIRVGILP